MLPDGGQDGYLRISKAALLSINLRHLASAIDLSLGVSERPAGVSSDALTGYTEWVGNWYDAEISVGWDWWVVRGSIAVLNPAEIRTNIQVIAADGHSESSLMTRIHLLEWIETLPWRDVLMQVVLARYMRPTSL